MWHQQTPRAHSQAFKKSDWQSALEHYTAALKLDANSTAARNNRALTYLNLGMHQEAADDCSAVLAAEPRNAKALLRRAAAYDGLGQAAQAVADLQQVLALEPNNASAAKRLGEVQQKLLPGGDESAADAAPGTPP
jgi:tetratricopeptide (TPR) repeat protein